MEKHFKGQDCADLWKQQTQHLIIVGSATPEPKFQRVTQTWKNLDTGRPNLQTNIISLPPASPLWAGICYLLFHTLCETQPTKSNSLVRCFSNGSPKCRSWHWVGRKKGEKLHQLKITKIYWNWREISSTFENPEEFLSDRLQDFSSWQYEKLRPIQKVSSPWSHVSVSLTESLGT